MKKKHLNICLLALYVCFISPNLKAQRRLESKIFIEHSYRIKRIDSVQNILFVYRGSADFVPDYLDLSKKIKRRFKKKYKVGFQYQLSNEEEFKKLVARIPKKRNQNIKPDLVVKIRIYDFYIKSERDSPIDQSNYSMDVELVDPKNRSTAEFAKLKLESFSSLRNDNAGVLKLVEKIIEGNKPGAKK